MLSPKPDQKTMTNKQHLYTKATEFHHKLINSSRIEIQLNNKISKTPTKPTSQNPPRSNLFNSKIKSHIQNSPN